MSFRSIPLIVLALILYNVVVVVLGGSVAPDAVGTGAADGSDVGILRTVLIEFPSIRGDAGPVWNFTWGDLLIFITLLLLFVEIVKATYTSTASLLDHGLSMLVFIACLIEFLMVNSAYTSVFFIIMVATLIDVVAGYTIGIRVARRDIGFGGVAP